ncbi:hypothetical protein ACHAWF_005909 [Thalassiosira exigua]
MMKYAIIALALIHAVSAGTISTMSPTSSVIRAEASSYDYTDPPTGEPVRRLRAFSPRAKTPVASPVPENA